MSKESKSLLIKGGQLIDPAAKINAADGCVVARWPRGRSRSS